jgi:hypothetical protein
MPTQKSFSAPDPGIVPVEGPVLSEGSTASGAEGKQGARTATQRNPYGPNNEQLPEKLEGALPRLVYQFSFESQGTRRQEVRRIKQAHQFWRGLQYFCWNERDQAMGRIGLVWRRMKFFHADIMLLAVDCFRRNRPNDVEVTLLGAGAAFGSKWIRLADLQGNLFSYPETDEQYPTLWSQQRAVLLQLLANPDPQLRAILAHSENTALIKRLIGLEEFVIPEEESRTKQYREIAQLVAEMPVVHRQDVTPAAGPAAAVASPGGVEAEVILPSIMPDEFADNHAVEREICMRWFPSDAGQVAKIEAPLGYTNVRAHALFYRDFLRKQLAAAAATATPPQVNTGRRR